MFDCFAPGGNVLIQGASRGIGLEFARQCLAEPRVGRVVASCRHPAEAAQLQALAGSAPDRMLVVPLDASDEPSIAAAADTVAAHLQRLHLVVNCAGVLHDASRALAPEKRLADLRAESLLHAYALNAMGPLLVARHFERFLAHAERAVFASISARVGSIGDNRLGGWYAYRASKAAQNMFTRTLSVEWARSRRNVICVALHPGTTNTDLSRPFQANVPAGKLFDVDRTVRQLLAVIDALQPADSGSFRGWDGAPIPW
jgi:NAD(P)-dependent dehydrogenase (short-subunit alcohol dehydrogenase family)